MASLQRRSSDGMAWAAANSHLGGVPRRIVFMGVGSIAKLVTSFLNNTRVHNLDTLLHFVHSRPVGTPLITVSNHMTTLDDPLMWGLKGFKCNPEKARWALAAEDICFTNSLYSYFFRLGKCIPITRGAGIDQPYMYEALDRLNDGEWVHTFPEGKICQNDAPLGRLKWGIASLIARTRVPAIVLPICHSGFEKVMPENYLFGRRPLLPLCFKRISIVVGDPMSFDIPTLRSIAEKTVKISRSSNEDSISSKISNNESQIAKHCLQDDEILRWLYSHLTDQIRIAMQEVLCKAKNLNTEKESLA